MHGDIVKLSVGTKSVKQKLPALCKDDVKIDKTSRSNKV